MNGSWFTTVCETDDPLVRARCDGFIQGVASLVRAQRFSRGCPLEAPAATIRREVMAFLIARPSRSPAAQVVWRAIDTAFPCPPSRLRR